ncbi:MAG: DUF1461 domain-containing protein [Coriobacteriia bacterium]|nr:DUF1461 domain-containing protein [Coriobacteriia bacterium]
MVAVLSAVTALGLSAWIMTTPWFTRLAAPGQVDSVRAGLTQERMVELAEEVRVFVTDGDAPALPMVVDGRPAFDDTAVSHLVDVRNVVIASRWVTLVAAALLLAAGLYSTFLGRRAEYVAGLKWGGLSLLGGIGMLLLTGLFDFDSLFVAFHGLFFQPGTWTFPADSLLILVFPTDFWILAGAITGVVAAAMGLALVLVSRASCTGTNVHK